MKLGDLVHQLGGKLLQGNPGIFLVAVADLESAIVELTALAERADACRIDSLPAYNAALDLSNLIEVGKMDGRNKNDGGTLKTGMLTNHGRQLEAVQFGHTDIHQNYGNIGFEQDFEGFFFTEARAIPKVFADAL